MCGPLIPFGSLPAAIATSIALHLSIPDPRSLARLVTLVLGVALLLTGSIPGTVTGGLLAVCRPGAMVRATLAGLLPVVGAQTVR